MKKRRSLAEFCRGLRKHDRFLLSCHVMPDSDAIGSLLAMDSLLRRLGKKSSIICEDNFPKRLQCLSSKRWQPLRKARQKAGYFEALLTVDSPNLDRIGEVKELLTPETVLFNLDHHISNKHFGHYNYVRPKASASGELVFDVFKHMRMRLKKQEATGLYVALSTDTGSFKHGNTTVRSHQVAAELVRAGIDLDQLNEQLYSTYSLNKINLYTRLLSRIQTTAGGRIAWVVLRQKDLRHSNTDYEDTEGFIDFLRYIREVKIAIFMSEMPRAHEIKVSFRSKGNFDVNRIATYFGGGGHKKAAGCTIHAPLEKAEKMLLKRVRQEFV